MNHNRWLYLASPKAAAQEAALALARRGALWVPGTRLPAPDPGVQPGDVLVLLWRRDPAVSWVDWLGAARIAPPVHKPWGGRPWLDTVPPADPLFELSRDLGYGGPRNYRTMARLAGWTEEAAEVRRLAGAAWPGVERGEQVGPITSGGLLQPLPTGLLAHQPAERARIVCDPAILGGKPVVRGTRIAVEHVLSWLAGGASAQGIAAEFPELHEQDVAACLEYAERLVRNERIEPALRP